MGGASLYYIGIAQYSFLGKLIIWTLYDNNIIIVVHLLNIHDINIVSNNSISFIMVYAVYMTCLRISLCTEILQELRKKFQEEGKKVKE